VAYGARAEHYPVVGAALLASLAAVAGGAWNERFEQAWAEAYDVVATVMLGGAAAAELEAVA
jgi:nitric oxide dioxygenase